MARKLRIGTTPVGIPKHVGKVNNKHVGFDEDYLSIKAYGRSVYFNDRLVAESTSEVIKVLVPRGVRVKGVKATHGAWLEVGYY